MFLTEKWRKKKKEKRKLKICIIAPSFTSDREHVWKLHVDSPLQPLYTMQPISSIKTNSLNIVSLDYPENTLQLQL